ITTDGYTLSDEARKKELIALKNNALTFVYFVGDEKRDDLEGIADHFISRGGNLRSNLSQYFKVLGRGYNAQKVLNVRECSGSSYANP
ncbi:MAG: hypothetical protein JKY89_12330, partial [Immundisolibacteraceae bacterium]|nr:hypothetical protein [Immundisolibacteraceae bacterium]